MYKGLCWKCNKTHMNNCIQLGICVSTLIIIPFSRECIVEIWCLHATVYHRGSGSKALEVCWPSIAVCFNWNGPRQEYYFNKVSFTRFNPIPSGLSEDVNVLRDLSRDGRDLVSLILISNPTFISFRPIPTLMGRGSRGMVPQTQAIKGRVWAPTGI